MDCFLCCIRPAVARVPTRFGRADVCHRCLGRLERRRAVKQPARAPNRQTATNSLHAVERQLFFQFVNDDPFQDRGGLHDQ